MIEYVSRKTEGGNDGVLVSLALCYDRRKNQVKGYDEQCSGLYYKLKECRDAKLGFCSRNSIAMHRSAFAFNLFV